MADFTENVEKVAGGKTNVVMDATILTALMTCPRKADFNFNLHLQPVKGKSNSLECGSIVHKFLEYFYKAQIQGLDRVKAAPFGFAAAELYIKGCPACTEFVPTEEIKKPECGHPPNEYPGLKNTPKDSEGHIIGWQYALDSCDEYTKRWYNDSWVPLEVEVVKGEVLYEDDEIRILWKAKLDWVGDTNDGIFPMDHKTMKQNRLTNSMNNQFMGQCIIMRTRKVWINKFGWQKTLKPEEKFIRAPVNYTAERLIEWQSETLPYWAKMMIMFNESGHFPPNFSNCEGKYGNCLFYEHVCSNNPDMRETELKNHFYVGPEWNPTNDEE